eukprot:CAMPEP_0194285700 /NCGR_PEP_ID=MMETSP0169-20130528/30821_1 /TAXON_ID=218684 /ORGANISM="Corethron pennatum, Strain L29A3" /LENGTH=602 /DNA_ID=CAMNT_0039031895 /DNA_START=136 /DNA_END=1944 /DNA_ORIENTATION=-
MSSTRKFQIHFNRRSQSLIIVLALIFLSCFRLYYFNSFLTHEYGNAADTLFQAPIQENEAGMVAFSETDLSPAKFQSLLGGKVIGGSENQKPSNFEPAIIRARTFPGRMANFLSWKHIITKDEEDDGDPSIMVHYKGISGLGHRLIRQSSAFHLTSALNISFLEMSWGTCGRIIRDTDGNETTVEVELSSHLFGSEPLHVPQSSWAGGPRFGNRTRLQGQRHGSGGAATTWFMIKPNEIPHYTGEINMQQRDVLLDKVRSDVRMYRQLLMRFRFWENIEEFFQTHELGNHTVYGVHIRAGNGEQGDFINKGRGIRDVHTDVWIQNVANLIREHFYGRSAGVAQKTEGCKNNKKPPLVFVATDTPGTIDMLRTALQADDGAHPSIPVISFPQKYPVEGKVTYTYSFGTAYDKRANDCLRGWENQMIDMLMLSLVDVMMAGMYSSFTQAMPIPLLLSLDGWETQEDDDCNEKAAVCDVSMAGDAMKCYQTMEDWYFKRVADGSGQFVGSNSSYFMDPRFDVYPSEMKEEMINKIIDTLDGINAKEKTMENSGKRTVFCLLHRCPQYAPQGSIALKCRECYTRRREILNQTFQKGGNENETKFLE